MLGTDPKTLCSVCGSDVTSLFLARDEIPVHQNLLMASHAGAVETPRGSLELMCCNNCGFVFNRAFDQSRLHYGAEYDNSQDYSDAFETHISELVHHLVVERNVRDSRILEVGCGRGSFLRRLIQEDRGNRGFGFDVSYSGPLDDIGGRLRFERRFFDEQCANVEVDVVVCRHVIEHVADPVGFLKTINKGLVRSRHVRIYFETPCVEWILRRQVAWDFFYEHCSYFAAASLSTAFQIAGFAVQEVRHVFGRQYLWIEATLDEDNEVSIVKQNPGIIPSLAQQFGRVEHTLVNEWLGSVRRLKQRGEVALWGAGAKGVTFANLIDRGRQWLSCVVDINPGKQGRYLPGTGHPIVTPHDLRKRGVRAVLVLNPNYYNEIAQAVMATGPGIAVVDLMDSTALSRLGSDR